MADTNKSIQVTIDVIVSQAKQALSDLSASTSQASATLAGMGAGAKGSASALDTVGTSAAKMGTGVVKATAVAGGAHTSFFNSLSLDVAKGIGAYNLMTKAISGVTGFLKSSVQESLSAGQAWAQVKNDVTNAGFSFDQIQPKLKAYADQMIQMGFDDEETAQSVSKLMLVTGDYTQAVNLSGLAADLARSKNIGLTEATKAIALVTQGNTRALKEYGIEISDTATVSDALNEAQKKLGGSFEAYANTTQGRMDVIKEQWHNLEQTVGDQLIPVFEDFFQLFENKEPGAEKQMKSLGLVIRNVGLEAALVATVVSGTVDFVTASVSGAVSVIAGDLAKVRGWMADIGLETKSAAKSAQDYSDALKEQANAGFSDAVDKGDLLNKILGQLNDTTDTATGSMNDLGKADPNFDGVGIGAKSAAQAIQDLATALDTVRGKQDQFAFDSAEDFTRFAGLLQDSKMAQSDWIQSAEQGFDAISKTITGLDDDIASLTSKITDAQKSFTDFVTSTNTSSGDDFAKIVYDAKQAVKNLPGQISDAQSNGQNTDDLQKQLNDARATLRESQKSQYQDNVEFQSELALLEKQGKENSLAAAYDEMQKKIADKKAETDAEIKSMQEQIDADKSQRDAYVQYQSEMTLVFAQEVAARSKSAVIEEANLAAITLAVQTAADAYNAMAAAARAAAAAAAAAFAMSGSTPSHRAGGGPVAPGQTYLVGEEGPELFTPSMGGSITSNRKMASGGGGVTININNPSVRSDQDIRSIIAGVEDALSRRDELSRLGTYK